jgi:hypothetical protein
MLNSVSDSFMKGNHFNLQAVTCLIKISGMVSSSWSARLTQDLFQKNE